MINIPRLCILVDCDDVLNDLLPKTLQIYNSNHLQDQDKQYTVNDFTEFKIQNCVTEEAAEEIEGLFLQKHLWDSLRPAPRAVATMQRMMEAGHEVLVVTATHFKNATWKGEWLEKYFPFVRWENVIVTSKKNRITGDWLIDDNMDNLKSFPYGRVCIDRPWNRNVRDDVYGILRVKNLEEAYEAIVQAEEQGRDSSDRYDNE